MYGVAPSAEVRAENIRSRGPEGLDFEIVIGTVREKTRLPLIGEHNVLNALAAVACGLQCGLKPAQAISALATVTPADKRGQVLQIGNITVINDCYNSNPKALGAMVDALAGMPAKRRIVVAGEMLELGSAAPEMHRQAGAHVAEKKIDVVLGVRGLAKALVEGARHGGVRAEFVETPEEAGKWLARETQVGDVVLLKASRGVKLERAIEVWKAKRDPMLHAANSGN